MHWHNSRILWQLLLFFQRMQNMYSWVMHSSALVVIICCITPFLFQRNRYWWHFECKLCRLSLLTEFLYIFNNPVRMCVCVCRYVLVKCNGFCSNFGRKTRRSGNQLESIWQAWQQGLNNWHSVGSYTFSLAEFDYFSNFSESKLSLSIIFVLCLYNITIFLSMRKVVEVHIIFYKILELASKSTAVSWTNKNFESSEAIIAGS